MRVHLQLVSAFLATHLIAAAILSAISASSYNPHEFATPAQSFLFGLVVWGVLLPLFGGAAFAVITIPLALARRPLLFPVAAGIAAGGVACGLAVTRSLKGILWLPWFAEIAVPGAIAGAAVVLLAAAAGCFRKSAPQPRVA